MIANLILCSGIIALSAFHLGAEPIAAKPSRPLQDLHTLKNSIPSRMQWDGNAGYCGEASLISAGLYYGQYISQYDARALATNNGSQIKNQLLLGVNDAYAAAKMRLRAETWDSSSEKSTDEFLAWAKGHVINGAPVAIGVFANQFLFYTKTDPNAGDCEYDHIVSVIGIGSNHALTDLNYYDDDIITFSDNGLWGDGISASFIFNYKCGSFQANRKKANYKYGTAYSLSNRGTNYGIAILGVLDEGGDTIPVRVDTDVNFERPVIKNGTNYRPPSMPLVLTVTLSNLEQNVPYNLYRYDNLEVVPSREFNAHSINASEVWHIEISSGSSYTMTNTIQSDEIAVYRAVKASAP